MKPILNDYKLKRCRRRYELMYNIITGKSIDTLQDKYKQDSDDYFLNFALNVEQGTDEWKLIRAWTISATCPAAGLKIGYKSFDAILKSRLTTMYFGEGPDFFVSDAMIQGNKLEGDARNIFQKEFQIAKIFECGIAICAEPIFRGTFGASPDGIFKRDNEITGRTELCTVEIKCPYWSEFAKKRVDPDFFMSIEGYPNKYIQKKLNKLHPDLRKLYWKSVKGRLGVSPDHWIQMQHQFAATGIRHGYYAVYRKTNTDFKLYSFEVNFCEEAWNSFLWPVVINQISQLHNSSFNDNWCEEIKDFDFKEYFTPIEMKNRSNNLFKKLIYKDQHVY